MGSLVFHISHDIFVAKRRKPFAAAAAASVAVDSVEKSVGGSTYWAHYGGRRCGRNVKKVWKRRRASVDKCLDGYFAAIGVADEKVELDAIVESLIRECESDPRIFNSVLCSCAERELVDKAAKWFRRMVEEGIRPDNATMAILMGLYQKHGSLEHAEYAFAHMRACELKCVAAYSALITMYTRLSFHAKAEEVIRQMEEDRAVPNFENWLVRLNAYSQQGKLEEAEIVLTSMVEAGFSPNIVAYNTLITGYGKALDIVAVKQTFKRLQDARLKPDEATYRSMIEGFGRADEYNETLACYEELKHLGHRPSPSNFYTVVNIQARHGDDTGVARTIRDMNAAGCLCPSVVSMAVHAYEKVGRMERVVPILESCFGDKILHDPTLCSTLVTACIKSSLMNDALNFLRRKRWSDPKFEDHLYHLLICSCKEAGHFEDAVDIYRQMQKSVVHVNMYIACSMIDVFTLMNRFADAENLYFELQNSGAAFDVIAYSVVTRMYIKANRLEEACSIFETMEKQKDVVPDKFLFCDMLRTYQRCGRLEKLAETYYWIVRSGIVLDEAMHNCIINCCGESLPVDELSRVFDEMVLRGHSANTNCFNIMLRVYGKAGLFAKARKVFWMARKQGLADIISYNTIVAAYGQKRDFRNMNLAVEKMKSAGYPVSVEAYNSMLDAYGKENMIEDFSSVLQKMKESGCDYDNYTYNIMINVYGRRGWIDEVSSVVADLRKRGLEPDLCSYNSLITAYGAAGMAEEAANVVTEMRSRGLTPDRATYVNLIAAFRRNENFLEAVKWSLWMKQVGCC